MGTMNNVKTAILLAVLTALFLFVGGLFGRGGLIIAIIFVGIMNFVSYFYSDKIVLKMYRAKQVTEKDAPKLYAICKELAEKTRLPMPKVYIIPDNNPNAFATGRNYKHAAVAATRGILNLLSEDELRGVMAHEFAHIKHRDILISSVVGTIAGVISYIGTMAQFSALFGGRDRENMGQLLVLAIITPLMAAFIQMAISRSREFAADHAGAHFVKNGESLASALEKLEKNSHVNPMKLGTQATAHLFISNPFRGRNMMKFLSTHPSTKERARRLRALTF